MPVDITNPQALHDKLIEAHKAFYTATPHEQLAPMCIMYGEDGMGIGVALHMDNKEETARLLRMAIKKFNIQMYAFFAEAWHAPVSGPMTTQPPPSQREDRKEAVITVVMCKDGTKAGSIMEINRDWQTGGVVLAEADKMEGAGFGGRFAELFDE